MIETIHTFVTEKEKLIFNSGRVVTFPYPIKKTLEFDDVIVVMLEIPPKTGYSNNVFAVNQNGEILWQIGKHPHNFDVSVWLDLNRKGEYAQFGNWDGLELIVEPETGKILQEWVGRQHNTSIIFKNSLTIKPQGEFITPEGLRIKFPTDKILPEKLMGNKFFM